MIIDRNTVEEAYEEYTPGMILQEEEFLEANKDIVNCFIVKKNTKIENIEYSVQELIDILNCLGDDYDYNFELIDGKIYDIVRHTTYTIKDWTPKAKKILKEIENE